MDGWKTIVSFWDGPFSGAFLLKNQWNVKVALPNATFPHEFYGPHQWILGEIRLR